MCTTTCGESAAVRGYISKNQAVEANCHTVPLGSRGVCFARVPCPIVLSQQFLLLLTVAFLLPLRLAFDFTSTTGLMVWDWFVDGALILDVIANFFVAYHDKKGALVESFPKIAKNYIKGW